MVLNSFSKSRSGIEKLSYYCPPPLPSLFYAVVNVYIKKA